ncbi:GntR family transcriptional regulator [Actinopolymorpha sp. B11F2]|uniref:GntR family transcriptional regulator n=1 Tax=Actinopolymorpha sp. B11F2 TaxID=3160862 RepID=UPI0032E37896
MHAYERVAEELAADIANGVWPPGSALPTIPALEERFGVSRITVRGGLEELARRGLVYTGYIGGRRGTIVRSQGKIDTYLTDALRPDRDRTTMDAFTENAAKVGKRASKRFSMRMEPAPKSVTKILGVDPGALVVIRTLHQLLDGEPWSREVGYYPRDLAEEVGLDTPEDIPQGTIRALADAGHQEIAHRDELTYETAGPQDAHDLGLTIGAPLLMQTRIAATANRVTRVMRYVRIAERNRLVWEVGDAGGLDLIRAAHNSEDAR